MLYNIRDFGVKIISKHKVKSITLMLEKQDDESVVLINIWNVHNVRIDGITISADEFAKGVYEMLGVNDA